MTPTLAVWLAERRVGTLTRTGSRRMRFAYAPEVVTASPGRGVLSQSLPAQDEAFSPGRTRPFFEGLLPEGETRRLVAGQLGLRSDAGEFELLAELGRDCAGAVVITAPEASDDPGEPDPQWLSEADLAERIDGLPRRPLALDVERGIRLSLAGVQPKLVLVRGPDGRFAAPTAHRPSTHILKPPARDRAGVDLHEDLVANERFCLRVLGEAGIPSARAEQVRVGGRDVLVVERFDRAVTDGAMRRLHQEDACQALGRLSEQKYADATGGVHIEEVFGLIRGFAASPARERLRLLDQVVAHLTLGNADAHGKNVAILYGAPGRGALAPLYDVVCTAAYPEISTTLAAPVGGALSLSEVSSGAIADLARGVGMNAQAAARRAAELAELIAGVARSTRQAAIGEGWSRPILTKVVEVAERQAERLALSR